MPQIIIRYDPVLVDVTEIANMGDICRDLVADAASTEEVPFGSSDIDYITQPYGPGTIAPKVAIEIRTVGRPERVKKLNKERLLQLKKDFLDIGFNQYAKESEPLIWMQFIDPRGEHV